MVFISQGSHPHSLRRCLGTLSISQKNECPLCIQKRQPLLSKKVCLLLSKKERPLHPRDRVSFHIQEIVSPFIQERAPVASKRVHPCESKRERPCIQERVALLLKSEAHPLSSRMYNDSIHQTLNIYRRKMLKISMPKESNLFKTKYLGTQAPLKFNPSPQLHTLLS